jgi:NAD-dependent dihydropyrimidine dehydrogenase PreA subunit
MMRFLHITVIVIAVLILCNTASAVERFPPPDFVETDHQIPTPTVPGPRQDIYEYLDVVVLAAALALSSYLVLKRRSRRAIFALMVFSVAYFGFWRKGCVCSIGAVQNVALSIFDSSYAMPATILLFFSLPLVFTLFFGRTFCAGVCPLGAVQDLVALRPMPVPRWLENGLRLLAYVYLGLAVLFAATGSAFVICRYDPFVAFFRLGGNPNIIILGACFLLIGVFVGRPYCRFVCPYGVVLRQFSRLSKKRVTITPDECVKCRLCEDSCPFGAIRQPTVDWPKPYYKKSKTRLALLLVLLPVLVLGSGWLGSSLKSVTSRVHSTVRLADRIHMEDEGKAEGTTDASDAFRATGKEVQELYDEASVIIDKFALGGWFFGGFVGLVIGLKLIGLSVKDQRTDYEADQASCLACGRCFQYCPREHLRLKEAKERIG